MCVIIGHGLPNGRYFVLIGNRRSRDRVIGSDADDLSTLRQGVLQVLKSQGLRAFKKLNRRNCHDVTRVRKLVKAVYGLKDAGAAFEQHTESWSQAAMDRSNPCTSLQNKIQREEPADGFSSGVTLMTLDSLEVTMTSKLDS